MVDSLHTVHLGNLDELGHDLIDRLRVRDVCSLDVYSIERDEPLDRVLGEMADRHIGSAIVTDGGKIAGVFTATDACRCFAEFLRSRG